MAAALPSSVSYLLSTMIDLAYKDLKESRKDARLPCLTFIEKSHQKVDYG